MDTLNLAQAVVVVPSTTSGPERRAVQVLVEEVERRTGIRWPIVPGAGDARGPRIVVGTEDELAGPSPDALSGLGRPGPEGFRLAVVPAPDPTVLSSAVMPAVSSTVLDACSAR